MHRLHKIIHHNFIQIQLLYNFIYKAIPFILFFFKILFINIKTFYDTDIKTYKHYNTKHNNIKAL